MYGVTGLCELKPHRDDDSPGLDFSCEESAKLGILDSHGEPIRHASCSSFLN